MATITDNSQNFNFAERTAKRIAEESIWEQYSSRAKFHLTTMSKSLAELAEKTFPSDDYNNKAYQEAIIKSLTDTISPEIGVKDFWLKMGEEGCKSLEIENGHLNFYLENGKLIDIRPYTQAIVFEAHSSYYKQRQLERSEKIKEAKRQLNQLMKEIRK
jgi:hypothetical protein